jgi:hypothetical protein
MSIVLVGSTSGSVTLQEPAVAGTTVLTLPATSGNVVVDSATQTLTNKTIEGGTVISGTAVASTSGTSIDFTSIPSWVKRVTVMFDGVSTNGSSNILIQIGSGSVLTSGYGSSAIYGGTSGGGSSSTAGFIITSASASSVDLSGTNTITLFGSNTYVSTGNLIYNSVSPILFVMSSAGIRTSVGGAIDRVRITTVNGTDTFDAGSINILYE